MVMIRCLRFFLGISAVNWMAGALFGRARMAPAARSSTMTLLFRMIAATAVLSFVAGDTHAQDKAADKVKIGLITTLSGPPAVIGQQQRNGLQLALKELGNKLG